MTQGKLPLTAAHGPDAAKIAAIVTERHGVVIPPDDPAWAIVTMNELVLRAVAHECLGAINKSMAARTAELRATLAIAEKHAGQTIDAHTRTQVGHLRSALREEIAARGKARHDAQHTPAKANRGGYLRYFVFALAAVAIFAYGFWMGRS